MSMATTGIGLKGVVITLWLTEIPSKSSKSYSLASLNKALYLPLDSSAPVNPLEAGSTAIMPFIQAYQHEQFCS